MHESERENDQFSVNIEQWQRSKKMFAFPFTFVNEPVHVSCSRAIHFHVHKQILIRCYNFVQGEEVAYLSAKDENHVLTLTVWNLEPKTQYLLQIQTTNKFGKSRNTLDLFVMTSGQYQCLLHLKY